MENKNENNTTGRDFSSISPSANSLLFLKGKTNIPFAKEAAELMLRDQALHDDADNKFYWGRVLHFEHRYWSIDQLLSGIFVKNILELSSGFSFRGLAMVKEKEVHYIDTDLPNIISVKKEFIKDLNIDPESDKGQLELRPLNALDEKQFMETVGRFSEGALAIVNEGLLMYLNTSEKEKLCQTIRKVLKERGGCWITADIYVKKETLGIPEFKFGDKLEKFLKEHQIEENKFESFEAAKEFFEKQGFVIDKEAQPDPSKLRSLNNFLQSIPTEQLGQMRKAGNMQATWRLKLAD